MCRVGIKGVDGVAFDEKKQFGFWWRDRGVGVSQHAVDRQAVVSPVFAARSQGLRDTGLLSRQLEKGKAAMRSKGRGTDLIGRAGEHYVAAELNRRGAYAVTFAGDMPGIDIVATSVERTRTVYLQVKTKCGSSWSVSILEGWATFIPSAEVPSDRPILIDERPGIIDHYWVFVSLPENRSPEFWIVPDGDVRSGIRDVYRAYLLRHGGKRPGNPDSIRHSIDEKRLALWKDAWRALDLGIS